MKFLSLLMFSFALTTLSSHSILFAGDNNWADVIDEYPTPVYAAVASKEMNFMYEQCARFINLAHAAESSDPKKARRLREKAEMLKRFIASIGNNGAPVDMKMVIDELKPILNQNLEATEEKIDSIRNKLIIFGLSFVSKIRTKIWTWDDTDFVNETLFKLIHDERTPPEVVQEIIRQMALIISYIPEEQRRNDLWGIKEHTQQYFNNLGEKYSLEGYPGLYLGLRLLFMSPKEIEELMAEEKYQDNLKVIIAHAVNLVAYIQNNYESNQRKKLPFENYLETSPVAKTSGQIELLQLELEREKGYEELGLEVLIAKRNYLKNLETFHNRTLRAIRGIR